MEQYAIVVLEKNYDMIHFNILLRVVMFSRYLQCCQVQKIQYDTAIEDGGQNLIDIILDLHILVSIF